MESSGAPQEHRGLGKGDPWIVYVDVYLRSDGEHPEFEIKSCLPSHKHTVGGGKEEDYLVFDNNGRPGFTILFQLHDETKKGYQFPKHDPIWSRYGEDCPHAGNEVFEEAKVFESDPTILRVRYKNQPADPPAHFRYTLNVSKDGERPDLSLDPGGTGNNGNSTRN